MRKIVYLDASSMGDDVSFVEIEKLGELICYANSTPEEALSRVGDCEVLIVNKVVVDERLLDAAPRLGLLCEAATGINNIDISACEKKNVAVRNVEAYSTDSVVQHTFMQLFSLIGNSAYFDDKVKSGEYSSSSIFTDVSKPFFELNGKTLGIIGMGNIGKKVADIAHTSFDMRVIYYSTSGTNHCKQYDSVPLNELLRLSDIVSIHAPLNDRTKYLIAKEQFCLMKNSAVVLNMGRGGIIDEKDLAWAIDNETIAGAAIDVFEREPLPISNPLLHTKHPERLLFSPHRAWASKEAKQRLIKAIAENIADYYKHKN